MFVRHPKTHKVMGTKAMLFPRMMLKWPHRQKRRQNLYWNMKIPLLPHLVLPVMKALLLVVAVAPAVAILQAVMMLRCVQKLMMNFALVPRTAIVKIN